MRSDTPSKNKSKNGIVFTSLDIPRSTQPSYLQLRYNYLESETPVWSINCNQKRLLKTRPNAQQNNKKPAQLLNQKRNHDHTRQFSPIREESSTRQLNSKP